MHQLIDGRATSVMAHLLTNGEGATKGRKLWPRAHKRTNTCGAKELENLVSANTEEFFFSLNHSKYKVKRGAEVGKSALHCTAFTAPCNLKA